jgi:hypothetical protein
MTSRLWLNIHGQLFLIFKNLWITPKKYEAKDHGLNQLEIDHEHLSQILFRSLVNKKKIKIPKIEMAYLVLG